MYNYIFNILFIAEFSEKKSEDLNQNLLKLWEIFFLPADINLNGSVEFPELLNYMMTVFIF
jgi:hypothetical protein